MAKNSKKSKKKESEDSFRSAKEEKLFQNLLKITEQFMAGKGFTPLTEADMIQRLSISEQHHSLFREILNSLIQRNLVKFEEGKYQWKTTRLDVVTGILRVHPRGFGFLQPENPLLYPEDIFIPKHLTKNAIDGDRVEVIINQEAISEKGPEGRVIAILSRSRTHLGGIIRSIELDGTYVAHVPMLGSQQRVIVQTSDNQILQVGDRLVMEVIEWGSKETETLCRVSHLIGHISDPSCDIKAAIEQFELREDFTTQSIEEAESFGKQVSRKEIQDREDLRELETFTIDPDTAKDYDDALNLTKDSNGHYHLGVHIADVSHYVRLGSALDLEAQERCNSTYFPGCVIPMLPRALSDNLCSLKANVNRLTISVLIRLDEEGTVLDYRITRSVIKSAKRFTYKEAKKVLDGEKESPHSATLALMVELCQLLKRKRYERGSLEFALPELVVLVDEQGVPQGTDYITYDITHQMVEEFMLKANEIIAWDLTHKGKNLTYRVHDEPAEENLRDFSLLAAAFGFRISDIPTPQDLQKLFETAKETAYAGYLASSYIRRMRLAVYSAENIGHYGLSLSHYCHFTSPIRRYVDLVVHRILFGESDDFEYLKEIAHRCSEQERISSKAESHVVLLKKLRLLETFRKENPYKEYEAIITRVKNFGIYFEVIDLLLEGFLHISEIEEDYFVFEESLMRLRGTRKGVIYAPGDRLTVLLKDVDFILLETKWYISYKEPRPQELTKEVKRPQKKGSGKELIKKWKKQSTKKTKKGTQKKPKKPKREF